jgi:CHAT domain-containing protein
MIVRPLANFLVAGCLALAALSTPLDGHAQPGTNAPPRTVQDILRALDSHPVDAAHLAAARDEAAAQPPAGADDKALADFYVKRARAANDLGLVGPQIADLRRAIELGGGTQPYRTWAELAGAEYLGGNFRNALAARQQALAAAAGTKGFQVSLHAGLADFYRRLGEFDKARRHVAAAERLVAGLKRGKAWPQHQYRWQASVEDANGRIAFSAGQYAEAEARFAKAIELVERDLPLNLERLKDPARFPNNPSQSNRERYRDTLEAWLASAVRMQGRLREAEVHARNIVARSIERSGQDSVHSTAMLQQLALVLMEEGRIAEALLLIDRALRNFDKLGVSPSAYPYVMFRRLKANALTGQRRWREALAEFEAMQAALVADPQLIETLGAPSLGWIRALIATRQTDRAVALGDQLAKTLREQMGARAYDTAEAQGYFGAALAAAGRDAEALDALREAVAVMIPAVADEADRSGRRFARLSFIVESYLTVLGRIRGSAVERTHNIDAAGEAFVVADVLRGQAVLQAMSASAARAAAGTPELADLVRREQDARQERDALYGILADLMSRPADQMLPQTLDNMRAQAASLDKTEKSLRQEIVQRFPAFADFASPLPAGMAELQGVLLPGEALLSVLSIDDRTFVWAIPAKGPAVFATVPLPRAELNTLVGKLRSALDPAVFDLARLPAFDGATAYRLFKELLLPVKAGWQGSHHLLVAGGGALARLPFALLLTAPPPGRADKPAVLFGEYVDWPWLARDMAVSQLPSASALKTLRRMKAAAADRLAFAGFGDPDFKGDGTAPPGRAVARGLRATALPAAPRAKAQRGEAAEWIDYSRIAPLPDTRDEILALAKALDADRGRDVFLGAAASRDKVFATDLSRRKVVAFATHGLLSGDFPGVDQPALALANPGDGNNGLLTLDDILGLKLDADWVVLSACNTAGGDGQGAEAVSGLGRAFFYAGSRSLLVTHWPVESVSAKQLVVGIFDAMATDPSLYRAEALRRSMLAVMNARGEDGGLRFSYAHPLFWAPYALVGDGGR